MDISSAADTSQYLAFHLGEEVFALDVSHVREILEFAPPTKIPQTPEFMKGVINLRGSVVPVIDMRLKLGLPDNAVTVDTCIIVVEALFDGEKTVMGALVDSVREVFELDSGQIEPPPKMGSGLKTEFIKGIGKKDDSFFIILNIDRVFSEEELAAVQHMEEEGRTAMASNG